jgi:MarR family transcriptional regulator, 2-MHQ and catechol-resistance regulon repressor
MLDKNPDVTRLCDRLIDKKYINRSLNPHNRRQVLLSISEKGIELIEEIGPIFDEIYKHLYEISDDEMLRLSDSLDHVRDKTK